MNTNFEQIKIKNIVPQNNAVSSDDGDLIFNKITTLIKQGKTVELNFEGISIITTAFLNSAIGQLYSLYNSEQLNSFIKITNVAEEDKILFKRVIQTAKNYFANKKGFEDSANSAMYGK